MLMAIFLYVKWVNKWLPGTVSHAAVYDSQISAGYSQFPAADKRKCYWFNPQPVCSLQKQQSECLTGEWCVLSVARDVAVLRKTVFFKCL